MVVSDIDGCASHFPGVWWKWDALGSWWISYISRQHKFSCFSEDKRCSDFFHYLQPHVPLPYILTFFIRSSPLSFLTFHHFICNLPSPSRLPSAHSLFFTKLSGWKGLGFRFVQAEIQPVCAGLCKNLHDCVSQLPPGLHRLQPAWHWA